MMVTKGIEKLDINMPKDAYYIDKDVPTLNTYLIVIVRDSEGRIIKVHKQRSRSPTLNFIMLMLPLTFYNYAGKSYTLTNITGGTCSYKPSLSAGKVNISYPSNNSTGNYPTYLVMIQIGSGQQPNPVLATTLAAPIANGSGSGQLIYGAVSPQPNILASGSSVYFYISQAFSNQSGSTIVISEVGIVIQLWLITTYNIGGSGNNVNCGQLLVWYDTLSSPISIPNGGSMVIYYTFTVNP